MKISKISNRNFGLKFSESADNLFQKSQDNIADISISTKDNDIVIRNNLNRDKLECMLGDEFILDAKLYQRTPQNEDYAFMLKNKNYPKTPYFLCISKLKDILNGKAWNTLVKKAENFEKKYSK